MIRRMMHPAIVVLVVMLGVAAETVACVTGTHQHHTYTCTPGTV